VLWVAIPRIDGIMLATVTLATIAAFEAFTPLAMTANHFAANIEAGQRLFEIVDSQPMTSDVSQPISAPQQASLAIHGLTFQYNQDDAPVLNDISLEIQAGEHVAIVGASGAGKSSLVNVLLRFWEFDQGQVLLDGQDIKQLAQDDVHRFFWCDVPAHTLV
jgi:ATP-binding cassette subfamily C protein CydC